MLPSRVDAGSETFRSNESANLEALAAANAALAKARAGQAGQEPAVGLAAHGRTDCAPTNLEEIKHDEFQ